MAGTTITARLASLRDTLSAKPSNIEQKLTKNFVEDGRDNRFFGVISAVPAIAASCLMVAVHPVSGVLKGVALMSQSRFIDGTSEVASGLLRTVQSVCNVAIIFFKTVVGLVFHETVYGNAAKILAEQQAAQQAKENAEKLAELALISTATAPLQAKLGELEQQAAGLKAQLTQVRAEKETLANELNDTKDAHPQNVRFLEAKMSALTASEKEMSEQLKTALSQMADLEKTIESHEAKRKAADERIAALEAEKADVSKANDQLKKDLKAAREENDAAAKAQAASNELIKTLQEEIEVLKKAAAEVEEQE